ncbi:hypothetical protein MRX96_056817 [Rhipicephalus microplus]
MVQFCLERFDGDADKRTTFDVVEMTRVVSKEEDGPCEGSQMQVRWRDKGLFKATLIAISEDCPELINQMDKAIAEYNRQAMADPKKSTDKEASRDLELLQEIQNTNVSSLRKENASLRKENEKQLKKYKQLDGYLKSAEALVKELTKCTACRSRGEAEEKKRATLPTSADAREPQRTCDPHHESPDLRVTIPASHHTCRLKKSRGHVWPRGQAAVHQPALLKKTGQFIAAALRAQAGNLVLGQPRSCCSVGVTLMLWNCSRGAQSLLRRGHCMLC